MNPPVDPAADSAPELALGGPSPLQAHFALHQARMRRLVRSLLRDEHAAEDIVQDAWVIALRKPPRVDPGDPADPVHGGESQALGAWFSRVAKNLALNSARSKQRRRDHEHRVGEQRAVEGAEAAVSSEEIVGRLELQARLAASLETLDEPYCSLLRDHFLGEQTLASIARRDGVPESTLRSRLQTGLTALRSRLDSEDFRGEQGQSLHWSVAFAPLATIPRGLTPVGAAPAAAPTTTAGSATAGSTFLGGLASLAGALIMNKVVLTAAAVMAMSIFTWQLVQSEHPVSHVPHVSGAVAAPVVHVEDLDPGADAVQLAEVLEPLGARTAAAGVEVAPITSEGNSLLGIEGTLSVKGTLTPPPPTDVIIDVLSGYGELGDVIDTHTVRSTADGKFRLEIERPDGTITLAARAEVYGCLSPGPSLVPVAPDVSQAVLRVQNIPLDTTLYGFVFTPGGERASGARVTWREFTAECNELGAYEMAVAPRYLYRVAAQHDDFGRATALTQGIEQGSRARVDFTLTQGVSLCGTVRDASGTALEGAHVSTFYGGDLHSISDASGQYVIHGFSRTHRDTVMVIAELDGYVMAHRSGSIPVTGDVELDLVLQPGTRVLGRVVDADGVGLLSARVCLGPAQNRLGNLITTTDDGGYFKIDDAPSGAQTILVNAHGHADAKHEFTIPAGMAQVEDVIIVMSEGRTVQGLVRDPAGQPLGGLNVSLTHGDEYVGAYTTTDEEGAFTVPNLPEGDLVVEVMGSGWIRAEVPVPGLEDVVVTMEREGSVRGRVVDGATGAPIGAFRIREIDPVLQSGEERSSGQGVALRREGLGFEDVNGRWDLDGKRMRAGSVIGIEASATGYAPAILSHVVVQPAGSLDEVVLELWAPIDVTVAVTVEGTDEPIAGAQVTLTQERELEEMDRFWKGVTNAAGLALVADAASGALWVKVQRSGGDVTLGPFEVPPPIGGQGGGAAPRIEVSLPAGN